MRIIKYGVLILLLFFPIKVYGAESQQVLDLTVNPQTVLFDFSNLKPGDSIERILVVGNNSKEGFNYKTTSKLLEGSENLYRNLYLRVSVNHEKLYEGNLSNFKGFAPRSLDKGSKEQLIFLLKVPTELGNEYQGLYSKVQFKFYVEGTLGGLLPVDGLKLPATGSLGFNVLVTGFVILILGAFLKYKDKIQK